MINKNEIITLYRQGTPIREISRKLGISRNTLKSYVNEYKEKMDLLINETDKSRIAILQKNICSSPTKKNCIKKCNTFTGDLKARFEELLAIDKQRDVDLGTNKQHLTAALLYRTLIKEGYIIGESTVRRYFNLYNHKTKECFIIQEYEYGQRMEYDYHQIKVMINGENRIYHVANMSFPKSNFLFARIYKNEKQESFIDSLVECFSFIGGVPKNIFFDNMTNVVKRFVYKSDKEYTEALLKLSNYYGFKINTCNPRSGNEKGSVENAGKHSRVEFFSLRYKFDSEEELNCYFKDQLNEYNKKFMSEFEKEKENFIALPITKYELGRIIQCKVDSYSMVSIETNHYSVPDKFVGHMLTCNIYTEHIDIYFNSSLVTSHKKIDGKDKYAIDFFHFIETFKKKPHAIENSIALQKAPEILKAVYYTYFTSNPRKFLEFIENVSIKDFMEHGYEVNVLNKRTISVDPKYHNLKSRNIYSENNEYQFSMNTILNNQLKAYSNIFLGEKED